MDSRGIVKILANHLFLLLFLTASLFIYISPAQSSSKQSTITNREKQDLIDKHVREGKVAYKQHDYQKALDVWSAGLIIDPHHRELQKLVLLAEEKTTEQEVVDEKNTYFSPQAKKRLIEHSIRKAKTAYRQKEYQAAYNACKEGLLVDPDNEELNNIFKKIMEFSDQIDTEQDSEQAIETQSDASTMPSQQPAVIKPEPTAAQDSEYWSVPYEEESEIFLPYSGTPLTLEQCLMISRANSLSVRIAREEAALARWKMAPARRALYPSFDVLWKETKGTTTGQDFEGRELTFEFQKPLITWGKTKALYLQAKINWEIAKRNLQKEITELDFKAEQSFFILANALQELKDLEELYNDTKEDLERAENRYKKELSRELEWLKSQSKVEEIYYRMKSSEKDLVLAELTLRQILNSKTDDPFTVNSILGPYSLHTTLEQCIDLALKNRADLLVNELLVEYNKLGQKVARSAGKFNVNLEGSVGMNDEAFVSESIELQNEWFVGLKATKPFGPHTAEINILSQDKVPSVGQTTSTEFTSVTGKLYFWNSTTKIDMKESDIKFLKSIDEYLKKRNSVIFEVKKNYYEFLKAQQQLENNLQKIKVAGEELKISRARLDLNEILDSELLESKDRLSRAKAEYGQALTGYYTAVSNINKSIGSTDYFDVKRGLQDNMDGVSEGAWEQFINEGGTLNGAITGLESYEDYIHKMEGKGPQTEWWRTGIMDTTEKKKSSVKSESVWRERSTTKGKIDDLYRQGVGLYNDGDYQGAKDCFQAALELDPEKSDIKDYLDRTNERLEMNMDEKEASEPINYASQNVESLTENGIQAFRDGNYDQAISTLEMAIQENPNDRRAKTYLQRAKQKISKEN